MKAEFLVSKIHGARVTGAKLDYVGSITIDGNWIDAARMYEYQKVLVVNNANGARVETYIIRGDRGTREVCLNGATAHHFRAGDTVIIMAFGIFDITTFGMNTPFEPTVIYPDWNGEVYTIEEIVEGLHRAGDTVEDIRNRLGLPVHKILRILRGE